MEEANLSEKSKDELIARILQLETETSEFSKAQARIKQLEFQLQECKTSQIEQVCHSSEGHSQFQQKQAEAEEEYITNTLLKRLEKLKAEKSEILLQVEREEEYLTNTLHKRVEAVCTRPNFLIPLIRKAIFSQIFSELDDFEVCSAPFWISLSLLTLCSCKLRK